MCLLLIVAGQLCGISPLPRNGRTTLIPAYISSMGIPSDLPKGHRFVSHRSVKACAQTPRMRDTRDWNDKITAYESTWPSGKLVGGDLAAGVSVQEGVHKLAVILSFPRQISDVVELPYRRDKGSKSVMFDRCSSRDHFWNFTVFLRRLLAGLDIFSFEAVFCFASFFFLLHVSVWNI